MTRRRCGNILTFVGALEALDDDGDVARSHVEGQRDIDRVFACDAPTPDALVAVTLGLGWSM